MTLNRREFFARFGIGVASLTATGVFLSSFGKEMAVAKTVPVAWAPGRYRLQTGDFVGITSDGELQFYGDEPGEVFAGIWDGENLVVRGSIRAKVTQKGNGHELEWLPV